MCQRHSRRFRVRSPCYTSASFNRRHISRPTRHAFPEPSPSATNGDAPHSSSAAVTVSSTVALNKAASGTFPPALPSTTTQSSTQRIQVLKSPLLCLVRLRVLPGPTVIKSRLCPRLRFCCLHLHRRLCRPLPRQGSFRLALAVAKLPLLASLRSPWTMISFVRILLFPDPPSTLFRLCRFDPPPMRSHLLRPCLVHSYQMPLGMLAPKPLSLRYRHRQKSSSSNLPSDTRTPIRLVNNARTGL